MVDIHHDEIPSPSRTAISVLDTYRRILSDAGFSTSEVDRRVSVMFSRWLRAECGVARSGPRLELFVGGLGDLDDGLEV
jgi:hypothetical protein